MSCQAQAGLGYFPENRRQTRLSVKRDAAGRCKKARNGLVTNYIR